MDDHQCGNGLHLYGVRHDFRWTHICLYLISIRGSPGINDCFRSLARLRLHCADRIVYTHASGMYWTWTSLQRVTNAGVNLRGGEHHATGLRAKFRGRDPGVRHRANYFATHRRIDCRPERLLHAGLSVIECHGCCGTDGFTSIATTSPVKKNLRGISSGFQLRVLP